MAISTLRLQVCTFHAGVSGGVVASPAPIRCSAVTQFKPRRPKSNTDQIILDHTVRSPTTAVNDPALKSTWSHRAWVAGGCATVLMSLSDSINGAFVSSAWVQTILAGYIGYVLADLGSGVFHWAIDNYGDAETPIVGPQIEAFQGHHKWPWTITRRQFANNLHALARAVIFTVLPINLLWHDGVWMGFVGVCSGCIMFSQQFHAWAHTTRSRLPAMVATLQDAGVLVSRGQHAAHHRQPFNNNYCIVSGIWNEILDDSRFFEAIEMAIFFRLESGHGHGLNQTPIGLKNRRSLP